ncbi:MAG: beta-ketoacyl-ACP synthase II [SAR86 cluster bacterium]|nr:beta-ketoacyl-ACP synthase II [SAR86 cluster bacterium]|tara:strand:+ start:7552 stop:8793 length:1242 start_codon:yes stop_codon:yes gene_type:complete
MNGNRQVVVTGLGIVSPVGSELSTAWSNILSGKSGVSIIDQFNTDEFATHFAASVKDFNTEGYINPKDLRRMDLFIQYGIVAAANSISDSGLNDSALDKTRIGVSIGSGIGGLSTIENNKVLLEAKGPKKISPFFVPGSISNMVSGYVSLLNGFQGPSMSIASACSSASHSIGYAARSIAYGESDIIITGGAEMAISPLGLAGFNAAKALSTNNENPQQASRPWDKDRDGFVLGEGAGCLVLEELGHAKKRGANIYAEIIGFGMSSDAYHITSPPEGGEGAARAMENAIKDAQIDASQVDYINAHGTSTPAGDIAETQAIKSVFGQDPSDFIVSSTKSMTGHLLGAAGAVEAIFSILSIRDNITPPTINLDNPDEQCDLNYSANEATETSVDISISNSFGFGGTNASLVFKEY